MEFMALELIGLGAPLVGSQILAAIGTLIMILLLVL